MFAPPERPLQHASLGRADIWVVVLLALYTLIVRGAWFGDPNADFDEQLYSLIGNAMLDGYLPFVDLWDRKPFGLFAIYAFAHAIGGPGPEAFQLLGTLFTLAGALMTFVLARDVADRLTSAAAGLLYIVLIATYGAYSGNSEVFHVPMMLAMALLVRDPDHPRAVARALIAMLIGGLALQVKYTVLPQCLFFGLWALWGQYRRGTGLVSLVGLAAVFGLLGILPTALVGAAYAMAGHWDAFVFANFISFFDRLPVSAGRLRSRIAIGLLPLAGLALLGVNSARRQRASALGSYRFIGLWSAAALATVFLPSTIYLYYLAAIVPPGVLLSLPLFAPGAEGDGKLTRLAVFLPAALYLLLMPFQYVLTQENRTATERLASAIAPHIDAGAGRCLLVFDGPTSLYRMTGSCLPTRFIYPDHLNNALERTALGIRQEDEVARILAGRPPVIVTSDSPVTPQNPEALRRIRTAIARDYREIARESLHKRTVRAFVLRE